MVTICKMEERQKESFGNPSFLNDRWRKTRTRLHDIIF